MLNFKPIAYCLYISLYDKKNTLVENLFFLQAYILFLLVYILSFSFSQLHP